MNNSTFSPTSNVMPRIIALNYKTVTTWAIALGRKIANIETL